MQPRHARDRTKMWGSSNRYGGGSKRGVPVREHVSQSVGRSVGPCTKRRAVSQSDSRSVAPPVLEMYDETVSPNEEACFKFRMNLHNICDELLSPNEGAFKICEEPLSPNEGGVHDI